MQPFNPQQPARPSTLARLCRQLCAVLLTGMLLHGGWAVAQPVNDDCSNASVINIPSGGYALGTFYSDSVSLQGATLQFGEYVPAVHVSTNDKSVWYSFSLATTREVRISLFQPGVPGMSASDAGWTLYRTTNCTPVDSEMVDPPIINIEGYTHRCLKPGTYLIQVSALNSANDSVAVQLDVDYSSANEIEYDHAAYPLDHGIISGINLPPFMNQLYEVGCQSIFPGEHSCPNGDYAQTTWHVFTTDNFVDHVRFEVREEPWNNAIPPPREWGYTLYEGDARLDSLADGTPAGGENLAFIETCDTLTQNSSGAYGNTWHNCQLQPNTTYSVQLHHPLNYASQIRVRLFEVGAGLTNGPDPNAVPAAHQFGSLAYNTPVSQADVFACNADMANFAPCGTAIPSSGEHIYNGLTWELNTWYTFEVPTDANLDLRTNPGWAPSVYVRLYQGDVTSGGCGGLTLYDEFRNDRYFNCLPAGTYSVQILGMNNPPQAHSYNTHLGRNVSLSLELDQVSVQSFGLHTPAEIDQVNGGTALVSGNTYNTTSDVLDCRTTLMPAGDVCNANNNRAIYRRIVVNADGILTVGGGNWQRFRYRLYRGDASTAPVVGNELQGLVDQAGCQSTSPPFKVCVTPGVYTLVSFGDNSDINRGDSPWVRFEAFGPTAFNNPASPEILDTINGSNLSSSATLTRFTCEDNPLDILGYSPCNGATKQVYREIYLADDYLINFSSSYNAYQVSNGGIRHRIFRGRISNGSISSLYRNCGNNFQACMEPGWYTIVTYGFGETFTNPEYTSGRGDNIGDQTGFTITADPDTQRYGGALADADTTGLDNPIFWEPDFSNGHTSLHPRNHKSVSLPAEFWDCADNLPLPAGIAPCSPSHNRVSFRVFTLTKPSYVRITGLNPWPSGHQSRLYQGDLRSLSPPYSVAHDCITDEMRLCNLAPGTYTLATFADDDNIGRTLSPTIYVDSVGTSKYDHAASAYDFGLLPNDSVEYRAAPGAPLDAFGRPQSNDFFFCTTGASASDPDDICPNGTHPPGNSLPSPTNPRRNLWYTFEVDGPGEVEVSVYNLTSGKGSRSPFAIYRASSTPTFPPADSTVAQGLELVATSNNNWWCSNAQTVEFYRDPCTFSGTDRYYILVDNDPGNEPNTQIEVGIRFAPAPGATVNYDHYSQANHITGNPSTVCNPPYPSDSLAGGTFTGCIGNLNCATQDPTDQNSCGTKTIWYTFTATKSGRLRINYDRPGGVTTYNANDIQLYRSVIPGDSTTAGLVHVPLSSVWRNDNPDFNPGTNYQWGEACMQPGRYYIMFTGCNYPTETVIPRVWLEPDSGDLCSDPGYIAVTDSGSYSTTLNIDCHTIGEGPGEDGTNMGCLGTPTGMKTQWIRIDVVTTDTVDIDIELIENTNVTSNQIRYRVGYGDCNSMTFENCVSEGTFIVLNMKCRLGGSYWIQSILPEYATGTIDYNVTVSPAEFEDCEPIDPDEPNASFDFTASCVGTPVTFDNQSTTGPDMEYFWDFGDGATSTAFEPLHNYATPDTYDVTLVATRIATPDTLVDSLVRQVVVNPVPGAFIAGPDTVLAGATFNLQNTSTNTLPGSVYYWNFCAGGPCEVSPATLIDSTAPPLTFYQTGLHTVCLTVYNGSCDSTFCKDIYVEVVDIFSGGPFDGFGHVAQYDSCFENIFVGGPYDGGAHITQTSVCTENIFAGGPYDGHAYVAQTSTCVQNIFAGGPYDGYAYAAQTSTCVQNIFAGGPYDGYAYVSQTSTCVQNIFAGGPYDGHGFAHLDSCPVPTTLWSGGPYDGHGFAFTYSCPQPPNVFAGGPYDGAGYVSQTSTCLQNIFAGGPYDGYAYTSQTSTCVQNIFAGGPYDGHGSVVQTTTCVQNIFAGGPFDGHGSAAVFATCLQNIFAGGPYDGFGGAAVYATCFENIFAGGPYDGAAFGTEWCDLPNIFAGGPYDGHGIARRFSFQATGDTVCPGNAATLIAASAVDWYTVPSGGLPVASNTSTFVTPPLDNTRIYYVESPCAPSGKTATGGNRIPVIAHVLGYIQPAFTHVPACEGEVFQFFNQTTVSGTATPSVGPTSELNSLSGTGAPPFAGSISFSSGASGTPNYPELHDGVHQQWQAWRGGNPSGAGTTQWVQMNYISARSVRRFYYWNDNNATYQWHAPTQLRLYYEDGGGWNLVKVFNPTYPSNGNFDTGIIGETNGLFANRWKIEVDVDTSYAPRWGEFQVFAAGPTIGGNITWDFGDGSPTSNASSPTHIYTNPGTYNVSLSASAPGCCSDPLTQPVNVCEDIPLSLADNFLTGTHLPEQQVNALNWEVEGTFRDGVFMKLKDEEWVVIDTFRYTAFNQYTTNDADVQLGASNLYRVRYWDLDGEVGYSNTVEIRPGAPVTGFARLFPNPVQNGQLRLEYRLTMPGDVELELFDNAGKRVYSKTLTRQRHGHYAERLQLPAMAQGLYNARILTPDGHYHQRLLILE